MPGGWLMWMLEQYGINHEIVKSQDFSGDLNAKYDVIIFDRTAPAVLALVLRARSAGIGARSVDRAHARHQ
jgi:hypothetical protein